MSRPVRLRTQIAAFAASRTILNTGLRMVYPFLPALARGVGVELEALTLAITARAALGIAGPLFGAVADRRGRRAGMLFGVGIFVVGLALVSIWPTYPTLFAAVVLSFIGKITFDAALQAYLGDRVSYERRGLAIAATEVSWSVAYLLGIPVVGWLIARAGWIAPFPLLAGLAGLSMGVLWLMVPAETIPVGARVSLLAGLRTVISHPAALAGLSVGLLMNAANELVGIMYGAWMENSFGLQVAALGAATAIIGGSELAGEGLVAAVSDRLGKRRSVALGLVATAVTAIGLPLLGRVGLTGVLVGLFLFYLSYEFSLVSSLPLMTELAPDARATMMAGNISGLSAGRMLGSLAGPWLFQWGMLANGVACAVINVIALAVLLTLIKVE